MKALDPHLPTALAPVVGAALAWQVKTDSELIKVPESYAESAKETNLVAASFRKRAGVTPVTRTRREARGSGG
jgi:hypothetical protein